MSPKFADRLLLAFSLFMLLVVPNVLAIKQIVRFDGLLMATNAYDEIVNLTYPISVDRQSINRIGQYLVTLLHFVGMSGGWIGFAMDLLCVALSFLIARRVLALLGYASTQSSLAALLLIAIPVAMSTSLKAFGRIVYDNIRSGWVYWITMPEAYYSSFYRSPEPQVSYVIGLVGVYFSLKLRNILPIATMIPFLYPFVQIPLAFIVLAYLLSGQGSRVGLQPGTTSALAPLVSYACLCVAIIIYNWVLVPVESKELLVATRLPIFSITGAIALLLYGVGFRLIEPRFRYLLGLVAVSPWVSVNTQILTGFTAPPHGFEQDFGRIAVAVIAIAIILSPKIHAGLRWATYVGGCWLLLLYGTVTTSWNGFLDTVQWDEGLLTALRNDSSHVVIANWIAASAASLLYSRQPITEFSGGRVFVEVGTRFLHDYLCLKKVIQADSQLEARYRDAISFFDKSFVHLRTDFVLTHFLRKHKFKVYADVAIVPEHCPAVRYYFAQ